MPSQDTTSLNIDEVYKIIGKLYLDAHLGQKALDEHYQGTLRDLSAKLKQSELEKQSLLRDDS